jgi:hypothetical protein
MPGYRTLRVTDLQARVIRDGLAELAGLVEATGFNGDFEAWTRADLQRLTRTFAAVHRQVPAAPDSLGTRRRFD